MIFLSNFAAVQEEVMLMLNAGMVKDTEPSEAAIGVSPVHAVHTELSDAADFRQIQFPNT